MYDLFEEIMNTNSSVDQSWTPSQAEARSRILDWFNSEKSYSTPYVLTASAGCGKTYLISKIVQELGLSDMQYTFVAFTGKAVNVLNKKGVQAVTLHNLMWIPTDLNAIKARMWKINSFVSNKATCEPTGDGRYELSYNDKEGKLHSMVIDSKPEYRYWNASKDTDVRFYMKLIECIGAPPTGKLIDESEGGPWLFKLATEKLSQLQLVLVDEFSMVNTEMMMFLLNICKKYRCKVLLSGDPFQLPPVEGVQCKFNPDSVLTEIVRQSENSDIVALGQLLRQFQNVDLAMNYFLEWQKLENDKDPTRKSDLVIVKKEELPDKFIENFRGLDSQIICGKNETRRIINKLMYPEEMPKVGDKIISVENDWHFEIADNLFLTNGAVATISEITDPYKYYYNSEPNHPNSEWRFNWVGDYASCTRHKDMNSGHWHQVTQEDVMNDFRLSNYLCTLNFDGSEIPMTVSRSGFEKQFEGKKWTWKAPMQYGFNRFKKKFVPRGITAKQYEDYQYDEWSGPSHIFERAGCLTLHKSQGSEFDNVLVFCEFIMRDPVLNARWLYTAITRAKKNCILVV